MTGPELKSAAIALYGPNRWRLSLSRRLGRDVSLITRWASGKRPVPDYVVLAMKGLAEG